MRAYNICWDTDGDREVLDSLPEEVELPEDLDPFRYEGEDEWLDKISDWLSLCWVVWSIPFSKREKRRTALIGAANTRNSYPQ